MLFSLLAVLVAAFIWTESHKGGQAMSHHDVTRLINSDAAVLLDVRDTKDFGSGHIVDAINIPYAKLTTRVVELEKFREKTIVVVDKLGQHAGAAGKILKDKGFEVARLQGGLAEWKAQNLPLVK